MDALRTGQPEDEEVLITIPQFAPSQYLLSSRQGRDTAVVFVHGFKGNPVGTWAHFHTLIRSVAARSEWWHRCDAYFYGYQWNGDLDVGSARLSRFLSLVFPNPQVKELFDAQRSPSPSANGLSSARLDRLKRIRRGPRGITKSYKNLVLVGHSQGCVVIRRAVAERARDLRATQLAGKSELSECPTGYELLTSNIRLFAPATGGFRPMSFVGFLYYIAMSLPMLSVFSKALSNWVPAHTDLAPQSAWLNELRQITESSAELFPWSQALRAHIAFGENESIVASNRYDCDPVYTFVANQNHWSICKPSPTYFFPFDFVEHNAHTATRKARA